MDNVNFVEKEQLIEELRMTELRSYFRLGVIDDADMYPTIDNCLATLQAKSKVYKSAVIDIENFKGKLPDDFYKLRNIYKCNNYEIQALENYGSIQLQQTNVLCNLRPCQDPIIGCSGQKYYLDQQFTYDTIRFNEIEPIKIVKSSNNQLCRDFLNKGASQATIQNGYLILEERNTIVYIVYESTENDGMIPDIPKIRKAIKDIVVYEMFKLMWNNGEQDVQGRMQYNEKFAAIATDILKGYTKSNSLKDFMNMKSSINERFNILDKLTQVSY